MRVTSEHIYQLGLMEVFVFGSNLSGIHGGGAAKLAHERFGAVYGNPIGLQGNSYAIPTKNEDISKTLPLIEIAGYVYEFIEFAKINQMFKFLVTEIGCGLAGLTPEEVAPLFKQAIDIPNIHLPERFWKILKP